MDQAPVIFLPGNLCDERVWLPCWRQLTITDRRYVPLQWANSFDEMLMLVADRTQSFNSKGKEVNQPCHLIGFSMGGYIASQYAIRHPAKVASLTLIGTSASGLTPQEIQQRKQILAAINKRTYRGMTDTRLQQFVHSANLTPGLSEFIQEMNNDLGAGVLKAHIESTTPRPPFYNELATLPCPVHFIAAEHDQIAPLSSLQDNHEAIPGSQLHVVKEAGHMMLLERPQAVAAVIQEIISAK